LADSGWLGTIARPKAGDATPPHILVQALDEDTGVFAAEGMMRRLDRLRPAPTCQPDDNVM